MTQTIVLAACLAASLATTPPPQVGMPPDELKATAGAWLRRTLDSTPESGRSLCVDVSAMTVERKLVFCWAGKASDQAEQAKKTTYEPVAFWPTAVGCSFVDDHVLHVAGRSSSDAPVLEKWTIPSGAVVAPAVAPDTGRILTSVMPPEITRESLPVAAQVGQIASLTVNPWTLGAPVEEIWVLDWTTKSVWGIDPRDGTRTERITATVVGTAHTIQMREHSIHGACCLLLRRPWYADEGDWNRCRMRSPTLDPTTSVVYDSDKDGVTDGVFVVPQDTLWQHPLWSTGSWIAH